MNETASSSNIKDWLHGQVGLLFLAGLGVGCLVGLSISPVVGGVITSLIGVLISVVALLSGFESNRQDTPENEPRPERIIDSAKNINTWPITIVILGIVLGAGVGIWVRNHHWLGSSVSTEILRWEKAGLPIGNDEIARRMFELEYPHVPSPYSDTLEMPFASTTTLQAEIDLWVSLGISKTVVVERLFERKYPLTALADTSYSNEVVSAAEEVVPQEGGSVLYRVPRNECIRLDNTLGDDLHTEMDLSTSSDINELVAIVGNKPEILRYALDEYSCRCQYLKDIQDGDLYQKMLTSKSNEVSTLADTVGNQPKTLRFILEAYLCNPE